MLRKMSSEGEHTLLPF